MKVLLLISFMILLMPFVQCQQNYAIKGSVRDSLTHEPLIGATVVAANSASGSFTDTSGNFTIRLNKGYQVLHVSYIGYIPKTMGILVNGPDTVPVFLKPAITETGEVFISARNPVENAGSVRTGTVELSGKEIRRLPSLMGEADLIRALHNSPGVQSSGDGNSGFYVRGGNVDQNLILLDNAVVYNPSHVLGFFSVFNPDIVSNATLIKSGIPSNYGGRLSSVLSVKSADGDFERHKVSGNLGLIYTKASIQGPLIKNKLSYFISFRKTYFNEVVKPLLGLFIKSDSGSVLSGSNFGMYDLNIKVSFNPGSRSRFSIMAYRGRDNFNLNRKDIGYVTRINWGNTLLALNWNHVINDSTYLLNTLNYSSYDFSYNAHQSFLGVDLYSSIRNLNYKLEHSKTGLWLGAVKTGVEARYYTFVPNKFMLALNEESLNYSSFQELHAGEFAAFGSWEKDITEKIRMYGGLRLNNYRQFGPYDELLGREGSTVPDTISYGVLETIKSYTCLEPRISIRVQTGVNASVKASYTRNYQFIHAASASSVTMPSDIWVPSTKHTRPQYGDQITLGYYRNLAENNFVVSAEAYFKRLKNQVELLYGLSASLQDISFENSMTTGRGFAKGIEFFLQKPKGRLTGSLGYSLSYTDRQFDEINSGKFFPAKYDRRHEANFTAGYKLNDRWDLSVAFVYATGNAMTVPLQIYLIGSMVMTDYSETNSYRMPAYHRMDFSAGYNFRPKGRFESSLNFSVFNLYNRANPFLIYFDIQGDIVKDRRLSVTPRQISIFPILPSISWNIKF